jgi:hypothetical protein
MDKKKIFAYAFSICVVFFVLKSCLSSDPKESLDTTKNTAIKKDSSDLKTDLKDELDYFNKPFDNSGFNGSTTSLILELSLFNLWGKTILKADTSHDKEIKKLATSLKQKVSALQITEFPRLRKEYSRLMAKEFWDADIFVSAEGYTNAIINMTGIAYSSNKGISETENNLDKSFRMFRFKDIRYRAYRDEEEYIHYELKTPTDGALYDIDENKK